MAMFEYNRTETKPELRNKSGATFSLLTDNMELDIKRRKMIIERNRKNGAKGGRPRLKKPTAPS
jgi:hypothetical protein